MDENKLNFTNGVRDFSNNAGVDRKLSIMAVVRVRGGIIQVGEDSPALIVTAGETSLDDHGTVRASHGYGSTVQFTHL